MIRIYSDGLSFNDGLQLIIAVFITSAGPSLIVHAWCGDVHPHAAVTQTAISVDTCDFGDCPR